MAPCFGGEVSVMGAGHPSWPHGQSRTEHLWVTRIDIMVVCEIVPP